MFQPMGRWRPAVLLLSGTLALAACASRPSADTLTQSIMNAANADDAVSLTEDQARCIADELLGSGLSDTTVNGLAENFDSPEVLASDADQVEGVVADAAISCANS